MEWLDGHWTVELFAYPLDGETVARQQSVGQRILLSVMRGLLVGGVCVNARKSKRLKK